MADITEIYHDEKATALWVTSDGVANFIYPDKLDVAFEAHTYTISDESLGDVKTTVYNAPIVAVDTYATMFIRADHKGVFNKARKLPLFWLETDSTDLTAFSFMKFPRITKIPMSDRVYLTYWTNITGEGDTPGEPYDSDTGEITEGYNRAMYYSVGTPILATCSKTNDEDTFYVFSEPVLLDMVTKWNESEDVDEPILDIHTGGGGEPPRWQDAP